MDFLLSMLLLCYTMEEVSCQCLHAFMPSLETSLSTASLLPNPIHKISATYFRIHCRSTLLLGLKFFFFFFLSGASWDFGQCSNSTSVFCCCIISHSKSYWCKLHLFMLTSPASTATFFLDQGGCGFSAVHWGGEGEPDYSTP